MVGNHKRWTQVIGWDRGRPARNAPQARRFFDCRCLSIHFCTSRSLRAGRPRSQQIT